MRISAASESDELGVLWTVRNVDLEQLGTDVILFDEVPVGLGHLVRIEERLVIAVGDRPRLFELLNAYVHEPLPGGGAGVIHEDVDRIECLANRVESLPDLLGVCEVDPDGEPFTGIWKILGELLDVVRRPSEECYLTAVGRESSRQRFTKSWTDTSDDCCTSHTPT